MDQQNKQILANAGLAQIPKILTLQDRNRHSPTYGCFDRNYWHYRIIDFPSGMAQEFVLPLALAFVTEDPDSPYFSNPSIRDWALAGIRFAAESSHSDGSCDDYFPFERAGGAAAFSLLACLEAYRLLDLDDLACRSFFARRAAWLAGHHESGRLSNHQALIALCLELAGDILKTDQWSAKAAERVDLVLSWQTEEGWFWEYEGCDPGYLTLTISVLSWLHSIRPGAPYAARLKTALVRAIDFAGHFIHPDGSFGGEYGSRNTYNYFPLGFELVGQWHPRALSINDQYLGGMKGGLAPCFADDHIVGHHCWNYLMAARAFSADRPGIETKSDGRTWFPEAKLLIERRGGLTLYSALNKGGVFKIFRGDRLVASDTQFSVKTAENPPRNAVGHLVDDYQLELGDNEVRVGGSLGWAKQKRMTTINLVALRLIMVFGGRFFPNLIRRLLQRMLITGKSHTSFRFKRFFRWEEENLVVEDRLETEDWDRIKAVALGCDQTSIYVVMSRTFQAAQLEPWIDLTPEARGLGKGDALTLSRKYEP